MINQLNILTGKLTPEKIVLADTLLEKYDERYFYVNFDCANLKDDYGENFFYDVPETTENLKDFKTILCELKQNLFDNKNNDKTSRVIFVNLEDKLKNKEARHDFLFIISNPRILKTTILFLVDDIKTVPKYILETVDWNILPFPN